VTQTTRAADRVRDAIVLAAVAGLAIAAGAATQPARAQAAGPTWVPLAGDRPLYGQVAVHDDGVGRMLLLGGETSGGRRPVDTRALDLATGVWSTVATHGQAPVSRLEQRGLLGAAVAVDVDEGVAVLVCNCRDASTYLFDLATGEWSVAPGDRDLALSDAIATYDAGGDQVVVFGGWSHGVGPADGSGYAYDMSAQRTGWRDLAEAPFALRNQVAVFDPATRQLWAFGGQDNDGELSGGLWRLDVARADESTAWADMTPGSVTGPTPRVGATFVLDPDGRAALLYGGYTGDGEVGDAWSLDVRDPARPRWTELQPAGLPGPGRRAASGAVWDAAGGRMVITGGMRAADGPGQEVLADAWALQWGDVPTPSGTPVTPTPSRTTPTPPTPGPGSPVHLPIAFRP
jgi:hypothetical protein